MVVFIKHIDIEGPDCLEVFLKKNNIDLQIIELQNGETLPEKLDHIDAVISLGGPMNVYEEEKYPFLKREHQFIQGVLARDILFVGICLGSQLLAKACHAPVIKSPEKEIGFFPVELTNEGRDDQLFAGLPGQMDLFHWHEDMSNLPSDAVLLASSQGCPHQAYRVGDRAYGIQFHFEVTEPTITKWIDRYFSANKTVDVKQGRAILAGYDERQNEFTRIADTFCGNICAMIRSNNGKNLNVQEHK